MNNAHRRPAPAAGPPGRLPGWGGAIGGAIASATDIGLIGRDAELAALRRLIDRIRHEGSSVLFRGEPGVGKSSVLQAAAAMGRDSNALVLEASGIESESMLPFAGLHQLLRPLLNRPSSLPDVQQRALLTALGLRDGPAPQLFLIALAALTLITDTAATQPVVLIVDDVQWIDGPTNDVLAFISRRVRHDPVMMITALRDGHVAAVCSADAREVTLAGLDEDSSRELLNRASADLNSAGLTSTGLTSADRRTILGYARGNPLALVELPGSWRSADGEARSAAPDMVPLTTRLERAFAARITELPPLARDALLIAAVNTEESLVEVLAGTTILAGSAVTTEILEPAQHARLVTFNEVTIRFRHPLVRSGVLYSESLRRRQAAHAAIGQTLPADSDRRVWHQAQSVDGPDDEVADRLDATHAGSIARGSVATAVAALERSAQLTTDSRTRGRRLLAAAQHAFALGRVDLVHRLVDEAEGNDLSELDLARAEWLREIFSEGKLGDSARILELCEFAARSAESGEVGLALDLLASAALRSWWAIAEPRARDRVVTVAESLSGSQLDPRCIAAVALTEPVAKGRQTLRRLAAIGAGSTRNADDLLQLGNAARAIGAEVLASDYFDGAETKLREQGQLGLLPHVLAVHAAVCLDLGDWRRAAHSLDEARRLAVETGQPTWGTGVAAVEAVFTALTGDTEAALGQAADIERAFSGQAANDFRSLAQLARGAAHLSDGQHAAAYAELEPLFDPADPRHHPRESLSGFMFLAEAAAGCGERSAARVLAARMEQLAETTQSPVIAVQLLYARPVLADDADAEGLFRLGLEQDLTRWPWPRARIQFGYGSWLRRKRRMTEAREPLRAALATFELIGAAGWAGQARTALRAAGERDSAASTASPESLMTGQEMQIARLAAEGLSNREIGAQLYLSPRTVGSHLYRIFPKLGIRSRSQLATLLAGS
jgi:DNA-binding CsgD family transcriptional regulator